MRATRDELPAVSVVVPTCRRDDLLRRCLEGVLSQQIDRPFEVVVVDDGQSSTVRSTVHAVADKSPIPVRVLDGVAGGPASARNIGWRAAFGEVIAFIDDDAYPVGDRWLGTGLARFDDPDVNAVSGRVIVPIPERPTDFQRNVRNLETGTFLTCNAFYRRSALAAVGGFDERFRVPFREDSDLQFRVAERVGGMVSEPGAVVIHPAPPGRFAQSLRLQRYSQYNALLRKKHPERYVREIQPSPPLQYYAMTGLLLYATKALMGGHSHRSAMAFGAWLAMTTAFFLRRVQGTTRSPVHLLDMAITSALIPPVSIYWRLRGAWRFRTFFV